ncbi:DUF881 domain-containing protein [Micromonospora sp. DT233]|uniref:DUF881 domain-containing protein n=1 Tax=Micromonospora sp. DT233 TaxID=3393432 RepID=UPI003CF5DF71
MSGEQRETGAGASGVDGPGVEASPGAADAVDASSEVTVSMAAAGRAAGEVDAAEVDTGYAAGPPRPDLGRRLTSAGAMIALLLGLLGFTLVVQLRTTSTDPTSAATRQEDLVRIFSDLDSRDKRLRQDIEALEESQRQLRSGEQGRQAALQEATRRADELGILAGTLPARGPGLSVRFEAGAKPISAYRILDAVQELRGAGAEAMQISGGDGAAVRVIASTFFLDGGSGALVVDGRSLTGPFTITVIGDPTTMATALRIPGGVAASVAGDGGNVIVEDREVAEVSAVHDPVKLEHARPVS